MVRDPVCGIEMELEDARATAEFEGRTYYFCCLACRESFLAKPEAYLHKQYV